MSQELVKPAWIPEESLRRLNPVPIEDPREIARLLAQVRDEGLWLQRGTNQHAVPELARIEALEPDRLVLALQDFDRAPRDQIFLNAFVGGVRYFFSCSRIAGDHDRLEVQLPGVIYRAERRDRGRSGVFRSTRGRRVTLELADGGVVQAREHDSAGDGLGVDVEADERLAPGTRVTVGFVDDPDEPRVPGEVRHVDPPDAGGWRRIGLVRTHAERDPALEVVAQKKGIAASEAGGEELSHRAGGLVSFRNARGETLRAVVDSVGAPEDAVAVVVPPAWGRTKESTVAFAETVLHTFSMAREPVVVVRFDGVRRRGESSNDEDCLPPVGENRHYTFSQGVRDVHSALDFVQKELGSTKIVLATFSIAAVEGRRAIVTDSARRVRGWVSIVGASDPQSMIRVVSGGVDYFAGAVEGLSFGEQYIQGLLLDVDAATRDAICSRIAFLDDSRRDMAEIDLPITWIYGADDAWTQIERVRDMLSVGDASKRRLIEVPTGHQLRTSAQALETFALAATEIARVALGREVPAVTPSAALVRERRREEMRRLRAPIVDVPRFWKDYLVGRDGRLGIELVSSTTAYRAFMAVQVQGLALVAGHTLVDLGSGAGALPVELPAASELGKLRVVEVDLVREGLARSRLRVEQGWGAGHDFGFVAANLDRAAGGAQVPLADRSADAVLVSLLLNYISDPEALVCEAARISKPGGRLVLSGMRPDADISKICVSGVAEIRSGEAQAVWAQDGVANLDRPLQEFISSGAQLLDLEEAGRFQFWEPDEVEALIAKAGFTVLSTETGYGDPPQAFAVVAERNAESCG